VAEVQNQEAHKRDHETKRRREAEQQREAHLQAKHHKVISHLQERGSDMDQCWEMAGEWSNTLDSVMSITDNEGASMQLRATPNERGVMQIFADFDFIDVTGVIRFVKPDHGNASGTAQTPSNRAPKETVVYEEDSDWGPKAKRTRTKTSHLTKTTSTFLHILGPSQEVPDWELHCCGEEIGEGEIQLGSDESLCDISFPGIGGSECQGTRSGGMFSGISFTGSKIVSVGHTLLLMLRISGRAGMMKRMSMRGRRDGIDGRLISRHEVVSPY
jgi:muconolactone delta-isomerase